MRGLGAWTLTKIVMAEDGVLRAVVTPPNAEADRRANRRLDCGDSLR
jgi:hypothetical protein